MAGFPVADTFRPEYGSCLGVVGDKVLFTYRSFQYQAPFASYRLASRALLPSAFAHLQGRVLTIDGTENADALGLSVSGDGTAINAWLGTNSLSFPSSDIDAVQVNGYGGDDTFDFNGPITAPVRYAGSTGNDMINVNRGTLTFDTDASGSSSNLTVVVGSGATATFDATQHLSALDVRDGGKAQLISGGSKVLVTRSLALAGAAQLDLNDNDMIVDYSANATGNLAAIVAAIASARSGGAWTASAAGITSSLARVNPLHNTTLGAIEAGDFKSVYGVAATFDGQPLDDSAVLVKYTYYGDIDFNGEVDGADYAHVGAAFNRQATAGNTDGWFNGDFDYNGKVDGADYALIDAAFQSQFGVL